MGSTDLTTMMAEPSKVIAANLEHDILHGVAGKMPAGSFIRYVMSGDFGADTATRPFVAAGKMVAHLIYAAMLPVLYTLAFQAIDERSSAPAAPVQVERPAPVERPARYGPIE